MAHILYPDIYLIFGDLLLGGFVPLPWLFKFDCTLW